MTPSDSHDLFEADSSAPSWNLIAPTPKSLPLPPHLRDHPQPRIRAPFQVTDLGMTTSVLPLADTRVTPVVHSPGLPCPANREVDIESLQYPFQNASCDHWSGLPAPDFSQPVPQSLLASEPDVASPGHSLQGIPSQSILGKPVQGSTVPAPFPGIKHSQQASNLTRVRIAAASPVVWNLWLRFSALMHPYSNVLQQMGKSAFGTEHAERFLNQFAPTTLVRYMTCLIQFLQLCLAMHVSIDDLSEAIFADLLISGALARRSDGSGPKCSITIKAVRWAAKQLGVSPFNCAFGAMIASFEKQKLPSDRRESLPYPLFIIMRWERRILQSSTPLKEVIILGGFLLLCWSGLRFSDIQRSKLSSWQIDSQTLRGLTWRAKTCDTATPFGVVLAGLLSRGTWTWTHKFLQTLDELYAGQNLDDIDFALPSFLEYDVPPVPFEAMTYAEALYYVRHYMTLPWSLQQLQMPINASSYSIHGLKTTILSWAAQANLPESDRRLHGKHRPAQMSVQLYSRDDILGSIRVQSALIEQISQGWRPVTPLSRGGQVPLSEPTFKLEQFKKDVDSMEWRFFNFSAASSLQYLADSSDVPADDVATVSDSSDESLSSSTSSSSDETDQLPQSKKSRVANMDPLGPSEEALIGLHRRTWHIMVPSPIEKSTLPTWQNQALKTACGRYLSQVTVHPGLELKIGSNQALCSHVGCRKGFLSIGSHS